MASTGPFTKAQIADLRQKLMRRLEDATTANHLLKSALVDYQAALDAQEQQRKPKGG